MCCTKELRYIFFLEPKWRHNTLEINRFISDSICLQVGQHMNSMVAASPQEIEGSPAVSLVIYTDSHKVGAHGFKKSQVTIYLLGIIKTRPQPVINVILLLQCNGRTWPVVCAYRKPLLSFEPEITVFHCYVSVTR